jgi:hypothetical protein
MTCEVRGPACAARRAALAACGALAALALAARPARAQQGAAPARRTDVVEIRAQAPVPQVVTVRPRVIPTFHADALDVAFVDRHLGSAIRAPYAIVPPPLPPAPLVEAPTAGPPSSSQHAPPQER